MASVSSFSQALHNDPFINVFAHASRTDPKIDTWITFGYFISISFGSHFTGTTAEKQAVAESFPQHVRFHATAYRLWIHHRLEPNLKYRLRQPPLDSRHHSTAEDEGSNQEIEGYKCYQDITVPPPSSIARSY
jgi:hypothetical protein